VAPLASHVFKHAWRNGVWNVYETISFDLIESESIERKAHTWFGRSQFLLQSPDQPKLHYLLGKPTLQSHAPKYVQAKRILSSLSTDRLRLVEEEEAPEFAEELEKAIAKSAGNI
jgi:hypothetical protein